MVEYYGKYEQGTLCTKMNAWRKIHQRPQNLSAQFDFQSSKVLDFNEKMLHWASIRERRRK